MSDDTKKEGQLFLSQIIELAQLNGARFVMEKDVWTVVGADRKPLTIYSVNSWVSLSDAAYAFCRLKNIPFTIARLDADRAARGTSLPAFSDPDTLRRKYE